MSKLTAIKDTTIKGLKKVQAGTLYVTDSIEYGMEKASDKVGGVILEHRTNHADRMLARLNAKPVAEEVVEVSKEEKKALKAAKKATDELAKKKGLEAEHKCSFGRTVLGRAIYCEKGAEDDSIWCEKHNAEVYEMNMAAASVEIDELIDL